MKQQATGRFNSTNLKTETVVRQFIKNYEFAVLWKIFIIT